MEIYQARYFVAVSRLLNFTRAAQRCHVTQPALTKAIQKLEVELGGELIHRERQFTQLTQLGKIVLPMLERMIDAAEAAQAQANAFRHRELVPLKIGLPPCVSATLLVGPLAKTAASMPGVRVELVEAPPSELPELLLKGEIGAAIAGYTEPLPERVDHWFLFEERFFVLTASSNAFAQLEAIPLDSLEDEVWLDRTDCETTQRVWDEDIGKRLKPRIHHRAKQGGHFVQMVAAGLGIGFVPEHMPFEASVAACPIEGNPLRRRVKLLATAGRCYTPGQKTFIDAVRKHDWVGQIRSKRNIDASFAGPAGSAAGIDGG